MQAFNLLFISMYCFLVSFSWLICNHKTSTSCQVPVLPTATFLGNCLTYYSDFQVVIVYIVDCSLFCSPCTTKSKILVDIWKNTICYDSKRYKVWLTSLRSSVRSGKLHAVLPHPINFARRYQSHASIYLKQIVTARALYCTQLTYSRALTMH